MFYVMLHVMFLMFSVVFLVDEVQRTSGNQSKRVLARDDGATMTTVDGINIAYFQGPNSLKVLSNRRRSIYLRPPPPNFNVASELGTVGRVRSCVCNIYSGLTGGTSKTRRLEIHILHHGQH